MACPVCYSAAVQPLRHAIAAALREVESGIAQQRQQGKLPLVPARVHLSLIFTLDEAGTQALASAKGPHSVTIEFTAGERPAGAEAPAASTDEAAQDRPTSAQDEIISALSQVFGAPGFDSSARATVFREALEGLSREQALAALAAAAASPAASRPEPMRTAAHRLRGVIQSGPSKTLERGGGILRDVLTCHPLELVLRVAEAEWKTQEKWL